MIFLFSQMWVWLLLAFLFGICIGCMLWHPGVKSKLSSSLGGTTRG